MLKNKVTVTFYDDDNDDSDFIPSQKRASIQDGGAHEGATHPPCVTKQHYLEDNLISFNDTYQNYYFQ